MLIRTGLKIKGHGNVEVPLSREWRAAFEACKEAPTRCEVLMDIRMPKSTESKGRFNKRPFQSEEKIRQPSKIEYIVEAANGVWGIY